MDIKQLELKLKECQSVSETTFFAGNDPTDGEIKVYSSRGFFMFGSRRLWPDHRLSENFTVVCSEDKDAFSLGATKTAGEILSHFEDTTS